MPQNPTSLWASQGREKLTVRFCLVSDSRLESALALPSGALAPSWGNAPSTCFKIVKGQQGHSGGRLDPQTQGERGTGLTLLVFKEGTQLREKRLDRDLNPPPQER